MFEKFNHVCRFTMNVSILSLRRLSDPVIILSASVRMKVVRQDNPVKRSVQSSRQESSGRAAGLNCLPASHRAPLASPTTALFSNHAFFFSWLISCLRVNCIKFVRPIQIQIRAESLNCSWCLLIVVLICSTSFIWVSLSFKCFEFHHNTTTLERYRSHSKRS